MNAARIGLYKSWVANIDEGWTRWLLEQYAFPYTTIADADVRKGNLRERFDVIVLPDQIPRRIIAGHQPGDRSREGPWNPVPAEYQGGIGEAGVEALKMFVQAGGRLITFDAASDLPLQSFGGVFAHIRNTIIADGPDDVLLSGLGGAAGRGPRAACRLRHDRAAGRLLRRLSRLRDRRADGGQHRALRRRSRRRC